MTLSKDDILNADDLPREEVQVPEWGGSVWVRTMMGIERDAFEQSLAEGATTNLVNLRARLAVLTVVNDTGERLFDDGDAEWLGKKSGAALQHIFRVAQKLNALTAEDVEELAKNSEAARAGSSTSP